MFRRSILVFALAALAPVLMAGVVFADRWSSDGSPTTSAPGSTCATFLANNLYSCTVVAEGGGPFHDCFQATTPGVGGQVDLASTDGGPDFSCDCNPTGSVTTPKFDASRTAFTCDGTFLGFENAAMVGKVAAGGKKIVKGSIQFQGGQSYTVNCVVDPTCVP